MVISIKSLVHFAIILFCSWILTCPGRTRRDCQPVYRPLCKWWNGEAIAGQRLFRNGCDLSDWFSPPAVAPVTTPLALARQHQTGPNLRGCPVLLGLTADLSITARCSWDPEAIALPHRLEDESLVNGLMVRLCNVSSCWTALKSVGNFSSLADPSKIRRSERGLWRWFRSVLMSRCRSCSLTGLGGAF